MNKNNLKSVRCYEKAITFFPIFRKMYFFELFLLTIYTLKNKGVFLHICGGKKRFCSRKIPNGFRNEYFTILTKPDKLLNLGIKLH